MGLRIVGKVALRDVLPVSRVVGKADRLLIENAQETWRAAAVLDVRLTLGVGGTQEAARLFRDEHCKLIGDARLPGTPLLHGVVGTSRSFTILDRFHGLGESDIAGIDSLIVHEHLGQTRTTVICWPP